MANNRLILEWIPSAYRETAGTAKVADIKTDSVKPVLYKPKSSSKKLGFRRVIV